MMEYPKLVIISDGQRTAALLDGAFYGRGIKRFSLDVDGKNAPELTLSLDDVSVEAFQSKGILEFEQAWKDFVTE